MPILKRDCTTCGEPIAAKRLAAKPDARRCVQCQVAYDLDPIEEFGEIGGLAVGSELDGETGYIISGRV